MRHFRTHGLRLGLSLSTAKLTIALMTELRRQATLEKLRAVEGSERYFRRPTKTP